MAPDDGAFNRAFARVQTTRNAPSAFDPLSFFAPEQSARAGVFSSQWCALAAFVCLVLTAILLAPGLASVLGGALFAALILLRCAAALLRPVHTRNLPRGPLPVYSILCPLYREAASLPGLIAALDRLDYPRALLDVLLLVEPDDAQTRRLAETIAFQRRWIRVIVSPDQGPRTKPKALNAGLTAARGDLLTVYDAEDRPHPAQLRAAAAAFENADADLACVQAPLRVYNGGERWISSQFDLEYAVQFGLLLPLFVQFGWPILLGGTSNHFRTRVIRDAHGWDSYNVTEDADLGLRLARRRWRVGFIAPPTFEEAPINLRAWGRQRTRWIKGHLMTWLVHMRRPSELLRELGLWRFIGVQLTLGGGLLSSFVHGPLLLWVLWMGLSGAEATAALSFMCIGYAACFACAVRAAVTQKQWRFAMRGLFAPAYWPLQSAAAVAALFALIRAPHVWAKTEHGLTGVRAPDIGEAPRNSLDIAAE